MSEAGLDDKRVANEIQTLIRPCIQCGTCTGSCPNAPEMDLTPRKMWRLVLLERIDEVMASRTFILCSDCYICTLRCPRGLPLTAAMEALKGIAFARHQRQHRSSRIFYDTFLKIIRRHGRIREMTLMSRYFSAMANPLTPFRFAPLGLKLMAKGKMEIGGAPATALDALFEKVAVMDQSAAAPSEREGPS